MTIQITKPETNPATEYLGWFAATHDRPNTIRQVVAHVSDFETWRMGREFTIKLLQEYRAVVGGRGQSPGYRNVILAFVKTYLGWLRERDELGLDLDRVRQALKPFPKEHRGARVLSFDEVSRLVMSAALYGGTKPCGAIVLAALLTGARRSELERLKPRDIDLVNGAVSIYSTKTRTERQFPMALMGGGRLLFEHIAVMRGTPLVFNQRSWNSIRAQAGLKGLAFKTTRACVSSYLKSAGQDPWVVDQMLGHSATVAAKNYDKLVLGVTGETLPQMYQCEAGMLLGCNDVRF